MSEWERMDSAPKDGTKILGVRDDATCHVINYHDESGNWTYDNVYAGEFLLWMSIPTIPMNEHYCKKGMLEVNGSLLEIQAENWGPAFVLVNYCPICGEKTSESKTTSD